MCDIDYLEKQNIRFWTQPLLIFYRCMEFSKKYKSKNEQKIIALWKENELNKIKKNDLLWSSMPLSLGNELHLWQVFSYVLQDVVFRHKRKLWVDISWLILFHQASFLQHIKFFDEIDKKGKPKVSYNQYSQLLKNKYQKFIEDLENIGISFDGNESFSSFFENSSLKLREIFEALYKKSLIYKSKEIVYWNFSYQTLVWKDDVRYEIEKKKKYHIRYFIDTKKDCVVVATHRPETIFGDVALAVNPMDKRYRKFVGKKIIIPIINKAIPLIADERVDMTKEDGVIRIVPAHDALSLEIAKDHNLPLDLYAIDKQGNFSDLAWIFAKKNAKDFFENIVQYLDDISNLDEVYQADIEIPYCKKTWHKLEKIAMDQWFLKVSQTSIDKLSDLLAFQQLSIFPNEFKNNMEDLLLDDLSLCISRQHKAWLLLPLAIDEDGEDYFLNNQEIIKIFKHIGWKKQKLALTLVLLNLFWDGRLQRRFSLEEMIDVFLDFSLSDDDKINLEVYSKLILNTNKLSVPVQKEFSQLLAYVKWIKLKKLKINKKNDLEVAELLDMLDDSFLIKKEANLYVLSLEDISKKNIRFSGLGFDSSFFSIVSDLLLDESKVRNINTYAMVWKDNFLLFVQKLVFFLEVQKSLSFDHIDFHPILFEKRGKKMGLESDELMLASAFVQEYGADVLRIFLASFPTWETEFCPDLSKISYYHKLTQKLWNAARYVKKQVVNDVDTELTFDYTVLQKELQKNVNDFGQFDLWICDILSEFNAEWKDGLDLENFSTYSRKALELIEMWFCWWYLEIAKLEEKTYSSTLLLWGMWTVLQFLHPLMPNITEQLWQHLGFQWLLAQWKYSFDLQIPSKNYKTHLFLNIVKTLHTIKLELGVYKHESVSIFIQANSDFLDEIQWAEYILEKLLNTEDVQYLRKHEDALPWYTSKQVIDILVGVKKHEQRSKKDERIALEAKIENKKEYLQYLRTLISSAAINGRPEIVAKKEKELEALKLEIESFEVKLAKIKIGE